MSVLALPAVPHCARVTGEWYVLDGGHGVKG